MCPQAVLRTDVSLLTSSSQQMEQYSSSSECFLNMMSGSLSSIIPTKVVQRSVTGPWSVGFPLSESPSRDAEAPEFITEIFLRRAEEAPGLECSSIDDANVIYYKYKYRSKVSGVPSQMTFSPSTCFIYSNLKNYRPFLLLPTKLQPLHFLQRCYCWLWLSALGDLRSLGTDIRP